MTKLPSGAKLHMHMAISCVKNTHQVLSWVEVQASVVCLFVVLRQPDSDDIKTDRGLHTCTCTGIFRFNTDDRSLCLHVCRGWARKQNRETNHPSKHQTFVWHFYNVGPMSSTMVQQCANVIQMFCVCWDTVFVDDWIILWAKLRAASIWQWQ